LPLNALEPKWVWAITTLRLTIRAAISHYNAENFISFHLQLKSRFLVNAREITKKFGKRVLFGVIMTAAFMLSTF
jgi:hypothetical protein